MSDLLQQRLAVLARVEHRAELTRIRRGLEKESLRIAADGSLAQTPHPGALGSALTHPRITTDFSEALLEFITPVCEDVETVLEEQDRIHRYVYRHLGDERLWVTSMPCLLEQDDAIPVARYGRSNSARMKTLYRVGLGHRYGRRMQTIAGIHYNFSLPQSLWPVLQRDAGDAGDLQAFITDAYFGLIRNFRRWSWLLIYLFGASPALCRSFLGERPHRLDGRPDGTLFLPWATSLRMGDLGYQSEVQESLRICYNRLDTYVETLRQAITVNHPDYEALGVKVDGDYRQLSAGLLQIENEFYSTIRPKRVSARGETPLAALRRRGVEYIEVRCLDVNPFLALGIDATQIRFLDTFLLYCLLSESPACDDAAQDEIRNNLRSVVGEGRRPGLRLVDQGRTVELGAWARSLLEGLAPVAALLDQAHGHDLHSEALAAQRQCVLDASLTPSATVLAAMDAAGMSFLQFGEAQARHHAEWFLGRPLPPELESAFASEAERSLADQRVLEATDDGDFDSYLAAYFRQYREL